MKNTKALAFPVAILIAVLLATTTAVASSKRATPTPVHHNEPENGKPLTTYIYDGCGSCGGRLKEECIYRSKGETLEEIQERHRKLKQSHYCDNKGCMEGEILYKYCD